MTPASLDSHAFRPPSARQGDALHWRDRAQRAQQRGDTELALRCWAHVRQLQPQALDAEFHLGCCLALRNQPARASLVLHALAERYDAAPALRERAARLAEMLEGA